MSFVRTTTTTTTTSAATAAIRTGVVTVLALLICGVFPVAAETLTLVGGTVHSMVEGGAPEKADVLIVDGKIVSVGVSDGAPAGTVINVEGLDIYPGFVDALSQIGLVEISSISATVDGAEMGRYNPHLTSATAIHPASSVIGVTRETGVAYSLITPKPGNGGVIAGRASMVKLDGWTVEEMAISDSTAMFIQWPEVQTRSFDFATFTVKEAPYGEAKKEAEEKVDELRDWLDAARHFAQAEGAGSKRLDPDLKLHYLAKVLPKEQGGEEMKVVMSASAKGDIEAAVAFAQEQGLDIIIAGGREAWKVKELLAEANVPVILGLVADLPANEDDPYDRPFNRAAQLVDAGVTIAFGSGASSGRGPGGPHAARTVPFEVGMATAYGLDRAAALLALTRNPAEMLGLADSMGTIESGKLANLIVVKGDPLEFRSEIKHLILGGREVSTDNRHRQLYELHRSRPMPEAAPR